LTAVSGALLVLYDAACGICSLPGIRGLVDPAYRLVARNRHRISRRLGLNACRVDRAGR
jgi:predicted DCC family thiol-disulfide oxidoreductase YuxK